MHTVKMHPSYKETPHITANKQQHKHTINAFQVGVTESGEPRMVHIKKENYPSHDEYMRARQGAILDYLTYISAQVHIIVFVAPRAECAYAHRHTPHACAPHAHNLHTHHAHAARVRVCPCARIYHCGTPPTRPHPSSLRVLPMHARMRTTLTHFRAALQAQR